MKDCVAVFTWKRDPLLYLCLEAIRREDQQIPVIVFSDRGYCSNELLMTKEKFGAKLVVHHHNGGYGNSDNVLSGMATCVNDPELEILHCIEDDVIIHQDWFAWARAILNSGKAHSGEPTFAVALGRLPGDPPSTWYESPCISWNTSCLRQALAMVPKDYCGPTREDLQKAADRAFPNSRYRYGSGEQDGLFLRIIEHFKWRTAFPDHAYASHIGFYGYNQPTGRQEPEGTFEQKVEFCRKLLYDKARRTEWFGQSITEREMKWLPCR